MGDQPKINTAQSHSGKAQSNSEKAQNAAHIAQSDEDQAKAFLPDLCHTAAVLSLVLVGVLLSLALTLAAHGVSDFSWAGFGLVSLLVQWVLLSSAATICALKRYLNQLKPALAVSLCYGLVLAYTACFSLLSSLLVQTSQSALGQLFTNVLIAAIFAGVLFRYLYLQQQLKIKESAELGSRLQALQSRIRPHFLFNSLNSIASLIAIKPELAEKLVVDLAHLFRASLQAPQMVAMKKELELCYRFSNIEKIRLGGRLEIDWQVEALPDNAQIPSLLLQPLLENAIYHGIQPLEQGGRVRVEVKMLKQDILLCIANPRLPGSELKTQHNPSVASGNGIALSNIRARLDALYGKNAYLRVVRGDDEFSVFVRYPSEV